jgi:IS605 OrfB family transposase
MMKTITTVVEELPEQRTIFDENLLLMANAQNFVVSSCYDHEETNTFRMHHFNYAILRERFGLPSQLAVVANKYACSSVKSAIKRKGRHPVFSGNSIHYDARSSTIDLKKKSASLLTKGGRIKMKLTIPEYFKKFSDWTVKESNLVRCKDGTLRLMVSVETPSIESNRAGTVIGVDRGITNLIATSAGWIYEGTDIFLRKKRFVRLRAGLQSKGTRSAKRHFSKMRGREQRFMRDVNHCISKTLINSAGKDGVIVLENLKGIRAARHRHEQNWLFSNWAFFQLETFLKYKGEERGVAVEFIPARDTSKTCSTCGSMKKGQRQGSVFRCKTCNVVLHADFNASMNILHKYQLSRAAVNQPIAPTVVEQAHAFRRG